MPRYQVYKGLHELSCVLSPVVPVARYKAAFVLCLCMVQVAWHPTKPTLLASSSLDGSVVVFQTDGSKLKTLQHSSAACGCAWASDSYLLATTSERGTVYV